jgi:hypothetical protein
VLAGNDVKGTLISVPHAMPGTGRGIEITRQRRIMRFGQYVNSPRKEQGLTSPFVMVSYAPGHVVHCENDVPLLLDERLWLPLCLEAHRYVEENKKWACENGYSFLRVSDPIFQKK